GRATWTVRLDADRDHDPAKLTAARRALEEFAVPTEAAEQIVSLDAHDGQLIVGIEPGPEAVDERRKVYVLIGDERSWDSLRTAWPILEDLYGDSIVFPGRTAASPPRFVAWKRRGRSG